MTCYKKQLKVPYYQSDKDEYMSPVYILKNLGEISISHNIEASKSLGDEYSQYGWMLNKWKVRISKYPRVLDDIEIVTWISKVDRFFVNREFLIKGSDGESLVYATSLWIFIDMERRKPARIKDDMIDSKLIYNKSYLKSYTRFPKKFKVDNSIDFKVRREDIDWNQHVNNANYLSWIIESVPDNIVSSYRLIEFEIDYRQELTYPNIISANSKFVTDKEINLIHSITSSEGDIVHTLGSTIWQKK